MKKIRISKTKGTTNTPLFGIHKRTEQKQKNLPCTVMIFFHPDYTVGFGISPNQLLSQVADYTAGGESHPAPKNDIHLFVNRISHFASYCNIFYS